jgi:hypothetical protein
MTASHLRRINQSIVGSKLVGCCSTLAQVRHAAPVVFPVDFDGGGYVYRVHPINFLAMICSDNDVDKFCWYCLICYAHMNLNYTIFADFFLYVKHIEHQTLVSFLLRSKLK